MTKEFITYNQALALKELGFDEPCLAYYQKSAVIGDDTILPIQIRNKASNFNDNEYSKMGVPFCSAPTYSQVFRWFREKYQLFHHVGVDQTTEPKFYYTIAKFVGNPNDLTEKEWYWDGIEEGVYLYRTYEQAEKNCLEKLISAPRLVRVNNY